MRYDDLLFMLNSTEHEIHYETVGISTFISMINTISETLKASNVLSFQHFSLYEQLKIRAQLS